MGIAAWFSGKMVLFLSTNFGLIMIVVFFDQHFKL